MGLVRLMDRLTGAVGLGGACLVVPLFTVMVYEVLARFLFNLPTFWAYELAYMMTGSHFALGIAYVLREDAHVRIDFLYARFPRRVKKAVDLAVMVGVLLPVIWWLTWRLLDSAWSAFSIGEVSGESSWNPVIWPFRAVVAFGFVVFGLQILAEIAKAARIVLGHETEAGEA